MYYVYILKSLTQDKLYIGYTGNIIKRIHEHNTGQSKTTKKYLPLKIVYLEGYNNQEDALDREKKLKQFGRVYAQLKRRIRRSIDSSKVRD